MNAHDLLRRILTTAVLVAALGLALPAAADEPPASEAPPPPAAPSGAWSPPAASPGGGAPVLPPPQVVRRRSAGLPPAAPSSTAPAATATATPPAAPPIRDLPDARAPASGTFPPPLPPGAPPYVPAPPAPPAQPAMPAAPAMPAQPAMPVAPQASAPTYAPVAASGTRVFNIAKTHNVPLADGDVALQLDVDYEVRGQAGRDVYIAIWFARKDNGRYVASALRAYADPSGLVTLQTRSARVETAVARFAATLRIPYRCFPVTRGEDAYDVEARVQVLRREGEAGASSLARGETIFRVYGAAEPAAAPAAPPVAPRGKQGQREWAPLPDEPPEDLPSDR